MFRERIKNVKDIKIRRTLIMKLEMLEYARKTVEIQKQIFELEAQIAGKKVEMMMELIMLQQRIKSELEGLEELKE